MSVEKWAKIILTESQYNKRRLKDDIRNRQVFVNVFSEIGCY